MSIRALFRLSLDYCDIDGLAFLLGNITFVSPLLRVIVWFASRSLSSSLTFPFPVKLVILFRFSVNLA